GGAGVGPQDVEGARPARGHTHRRLRRRDRGDDRRRGVPGPRRAGAPDRGARHACSLRAGAREGVHPPGRRCRPRTQGALGVLMATGTAVDVVMPQMGVSVSEGTITKWNKQVGESIDADETLLEISTDKVDTEVPSPAAGVVTEILVPEGETGDVGTVLARIGGEGGGAAAPPEPATQPAADAAEASASEGQTSAPEPAPLAQPAQ